MKERGLHVETVGVGPRLVLVHGSIGAGWEAWSEQRPLAERFTLVVPHRSGYPPGPSIDRIDFERQADEIAGLLRPGDHLVGHSYGAVVALLAAPRVEGLGSLTAIEPPAFGVVPDNPDVALLQQRLAHHFGCTDDPARYLAGFAHILGGGDTENIEAEPLSPSLEPFVRAFMVERPPWEADIPLDLLRAADFPILVVSGGWSGAFDAVCSAIARATAAEQVILEGAGHAVQALGTPFNDVLAAFVEGVLPATA